MNNHPAYRNKDTEAVERAGHDPKLGTWPGDEGFEGTGAVTLPEYYADRLRVIAERTRGGRHEHAGNDIDWLLARVRELEDGARKYRREASEPDLVTEEDLLKEIAKNCRKEEATVQAEEIAEEIAEAKERHVFVLGELLSAINRRAAEAAQQGFRLTFFNQGDFDEESRLTIPSLHVTFE